MSADHELLFGFLALQNDCVSREDLIAGVQVWLKDKSKPLAEILVQRQSIDSDACDLLQRLTERHLQRHGDDPQKSLAVLSSLGSLKAPLMQLGDPDVDACVAAVNKNHAEHRVESVASDLAATFVPNRAGHGTSSDRSADSRFRILRPHARGGLGEVFVARDEELNRDVALKEIQNHLGDDPDSRRRFVLEAEVTGGLEHPGIVPVYGLGQYEDGRPYYAMRFIKGDSLKEAIDEFHSTSVMSRKALAAGFVTDSGKAESGERKAGGTAPGYESLAFRKLLGRFIDVCQAISYAHSRGVLHRDLKPGNIMLGKYGETLVVDWGLAKVRDRDDSSKTTDEATLRPSSGSGVTPTMMGSAIGTPAYMPPEQAAGRLGELGPASDVYSLGATLYHLLTGSSPFRGTDPGAVLKYVQSGRFSAPRTVLPYVPRPLEAVCLKAMALKPADRYASPQLLADDIEHYLADEPVTAFPEPLAVRSRRWMRRHQAIVSTTAACVLMAVVGLSAFSAVVTGKNQQLADANTKERSARQQAETNEKRAIAGEHLARKNAEAATEQSSLALSTMNSVIIDLQRSLSHVAGGAAVRRQLLSTVLPKLEQVSTEFASKSAVDRNTMTALMELGDVVLQLGDVGQASSLSEPSVPLSVGTSREVGLLSGNRTHDNSAVAAVGRLYKRAHQIAQKLAATAPDDTIAQHDLSVSFERLGNLATAQGDLPEAQRLFGESLPIAQQLAESDPNKAEWQHDLSSSFISLGELATAQGNLPEAQRLFGESRRIAQRLAESDPANAEWQRDLAVSFNRLGNLATAQGNLPEAQRLFGELLRITQRLAESDPANAEWQRNLSVSFEKLGDLAAEQGNLPEAQRLFGESLRIAQRLAESDPANAVWQRDRAVSLNTLGDLAAQQGNLPEAQRLFGESLGIRQRLAESDPANVAWQRDLSVSFDYLGELATAQGNLPEAERHFGESHRITQQLAESDPTNAEWQRDLSASFVSLGDLATEKVNLPEAQRFFGESLGIMQRLAESDPTNAERQRDLSVSLIMLGDLAAEQGNLPEAQRLFGESLRIQQRLVESDPDNARWQFNLGIANERLGNLATASGNLDEAQVYHSARYDIIRRLAESDPANAEWQRDLSVSFTKSAVLAASQENLPEAQRLFGESLGIMQRLAETAPDNAQWQHDLMGSHFNLATIQMARDEFVVAAESFEAGVRILHAMIERGINVEQSRAELAMLESQLQSARMAEVALGNWEMLLLRSAEELPALLDFRGIQCSKRSRFEDAAQAAAKLCELGNAENGHLYNAACVFSLCAASIEAAEGSELTAEQTDQRQTWINEAIAALKQSIDKGWTDFAHMQQDSDLTILRDRPEFKALIPASSPM